MKDVKIQFENGQSNLVLDEVKWENLPKISIVTITYNRYFLFPIAIRNFYKFIYPKEKLEWIIVDDSSETPKIKELLPEDNRIKYHYVDKMSIAEKRNYACNLASFDYISMMDDDDYYYPDGLIAKVRSIITHKKDCLVSLNLPCFNLTTLEQFRVRAKENQYPEATFFFKKDFIKYQKFKEHPHGEGVPFIEGREHRLINLHGQFTMIAITHNKNITSQLRSGNNLDKSYKERYTFINDLDKDTKRFLMELRGYDNTFKNKA